MCAKDDGDPKGGEIDLESLMPRGWYGGGFRLLLDWNAKPRLYLHAEVRRASTC
jgi:hypothetical protein